MGNKVDPSGDYIFSDKVLIFISVKEMVLYTGKSPHVAPLFFGDIETVPQRLTL